MTPEQQQELSDRLAEINSQLDPDRLANERHDPSQRAANQRLYGEMVALERRLFGAAARD